MINAVGHEVATLQSVVEEIFVYRVTGRMDGKVSARFDVAAPDRRTAWELAKRWLSSGHAGLGLMRTTVEYADVKRRAGRDRLLIGPWPVYA